jgi:hypothetical protein
MTTSIDTHSQETESQVQVSAHGVVDDAARDRARRKAADLLALAPRPPRTAHVRLRMEANPALSRPALAEAELAMADHCFRAHVSAPSVDQALHLLDARLRRQIRAARDRALTRRREGEPARPDGVPAAARPVGDRAIVRRTTVALPTLPVFEAAAMLEDLQQEILLFRHDSTGRDVAMRRDDQGWYELVLDPPAMEEWEATARLDATAETSVVFTDPPTGLVRVLHRRDDGNYAILAAPGDDRTG